MQNRRLLRQMPCRNGKTEVLPFHQIFFKDNAEEDCYCYFGSKLDATKAVCDEIALSLPTLFCASRTARGCVPCAARISTRGNAVAAAKNKTFFPPLKI